MYTRMAGTSYIKIQKHLWEIKVAAFAHSAGSVTEQLKKSKEGKKTDKENRGESRGFGDVGNLYLMTYEDFPKTITWGVLKSLEETFHSVLRIFEEALGPLSTLPFLSSCHLFSEKLPCYHHDLEKAYVY